MHSENKRSHKANRFNFSFLNKMNKADQFKLLFDLADRKNIECLKHIDLSAIIIYNCYTLLRNGKISGT